MLRERQYAFNIRNLITTDKKANTKLNVSLESASVSRMSNDWKKSCKTNLQQRPINVMYTRDNKKFKVDNLMIINQIKHPE